MDNKVIATCGKCGTQQQLSMEAVNIGLMCPACGNKDGFRFQEATEIYEQLPIDLAPIAAAVRSVIVPQYDLDAFMDLIRQKIGSVAFIITEGQFKERLDQAVKDAVKDLKSPGFAIVIGQNKED